MITCYKCGRELDLHHEKMVKSTIAHRDNDGVVTLTAHYYCEECSREKIREYGFTEDKIKEAEG